MASWSPFMRLARSKQMTAHCRDWLGLGAICRFSENSMKSFLDCSYGDNLHLRQHFIGNLRDILCILGRNDYRFSSSLDSGSYLIRYAPDSKHSSVQSNLSG